MKCISVFLLTAAVAVAADFTTGQAARLVIGQPTFTSQDPSSSDSVLGAASGLAFAGDTLFVADSNRVGATPINHRVLFFRNISGMLPKPTDVIDEAGRKCPACLGTASLVLGQPDFKTATQPTSATNSNLRLPTAVATDGVRLIVADTDHNRVLIWNSIPATSSTPADVVVGQPNFTSTVIPPGGFPTASSLRGPQGVWLQNGKLFVADTQNNRVLIYNSIPTSNGAAASVVLGQPTFESFVQVDLTQQDTAATASNLLNPVSVTSDGQRLYVTDLGFNRVLVWNSIPSSNAAPADIALGQPNLTSSVPNNAYTVDADNKDKQTPVLCTQSTGTDDNDNPVYPAMCNATLNFPRYALAAGGRLFIADGGNDRVLVFSAIPSTSGASADHILGQIGGTVNQASDAADSLRTPMSLAWDGTNLYVSDAFNRRITVYSVGENAIPYSGIRNGASFEIHASGTVNIGGTITAGNVLTITINDTNYTHTVEATDTINGLIDIFVAEINNSNEGAGDPNVSAFADYAGGNVRLMAKLIGEEGNSVEYSVTVSSSATVILTTAGTNLSGGGDAAKTAPGALVTIWAKPGEVLAYTPAQADLTKDELPRRLAGTTVYFNGYEAPLLYVSPQQINAQVPWEIYDTSSINAFVRSTKPDGTVVATTPVALTIVSASPGIFAYTGQRPAIGVVLHGTSHASGIVSVDGTPTEGDVATVKISDRSYAYTIKKDETVRTVREALINLINASDPQVRAIPSGQFTRIILEAKVEGPDGNGIPYSAEAEGDIVVTAFDIALCCANLAGSLVTPENPAVPGEIILIYATGVGLPQDTATYSSFYQTGVKFPIDMPITAPIESLSSIAGAKTADVLSATPKPGMFGVFEVQLHLNRDLDTDPFMKLTIAQDVSVSNEVTFPLVNPAQPSQ